MTKFFLSSHGHLASGLASSLDILLGGHDKVTVFDAYVDEKSLNDAFQSMFYTSLIQDTLSSLDIQNEHRESNVYCNLFQNRLHFHFS